MGAADAEAQAIKIGSGRRRWTAEKLSVRVRVNVLRAMQESAKLQRQERSFLKE
jgi:hypothetical protein